MSGEKLNQQLMELLAGKALDDLSEEEQAKLASVDIDSVDGELEELEATVAAIQVAMLQQSGDLPFELQSRIRSSAGSYLDGNSGADRQEVHEESIVRVAKPAGSSERSTDPVFRAREAFAWITAAAALILAVGIFLAGTGAPKRTGSVASARTDLLDRAADLVQVVWANGTTPFESQVTGDVVWSNRFQEGYLRFVGMPVNDPLIEQYQLWIIDPERDEEPIDGGVFDIGSSGEVIVKIDPKLKVVDPRAFAITVEQPGGVVVSTQERLPLIAQVTL